MIRLNSIIYMVVFFAFLTSNILSYTLGIRHEKNDRRKDELSLANSRISMIKEQEKISSNIDKKNFSIKKNIDKRTKEIIRKVPTYVSKENDMSCVINSNVIRLHNDAVNIGLS